MNPLLSLSLLGSFLLFSFQGSDAFVVPQLPFVATSPASTRIIQLGPGWVTSIPQSVLDLLHTDAAALQLHEPFLGLSVSVRNQLMLLAQRAFGPGYMDVSAYYASEAEAQQTLSHPIGPAVAFEFPQKMHHITLVRSLMAQVNTTHLYETIETLSTHFPTRHHRSSYNKAVAQWVYSQWERLLQSANRTYDLQLFTGPSTRQPSVVLTLPGYDPQYAQDVLVVGAHEDSVAGFSAESRAPGADDDASGLASVTELLRLILSHDIRLSRTLKLMAFAGEEGGLLGSRDVAKHMRASQERVVGMLQMEMSGYRGRDRLTVMKDTHSAMAKHLVQLADFYIDEVQVEEGECGYGCSDHFSFHAEGFPAVCIAEAGPHGPRLNPNIHRETDTLQQLDMNFLQQFTRLSLAFVVENGLPAKESD